MLELPEAFKEKMKGLLGKEYQAFLESYQQERVQGLRVNPLKTDIESFLEEAPFHLKPIPWSKEGFYYEIEDRPGRHPWHEAGAYYIQEPSAMAAAELLDPQPGERILDLCAAPGGKSTHIAGRMRGEGLLVSNEIHPARAKILSQNIERMGIVNAVVTNEDSARLAQHFPEFFHRIGVDAPCSGEGMFRKDEAARGQWSPDHVKLCAARQLEILSNAAVMLKKGGRLVYSTCTFSPEENEQVVEAFLDSHEDFYIEDAGKIPGLSQGRPEWSNSKREELKYTYRIWPQLTEGEGHYLAVLRKKGEISEETVSVSAQSVRDGKKKPSPRDREDEKQFKEMWDQVLADSVGWNLKGKWIFFGEQLYLLPSQMPDIHGLKVVRPGLHVATRKKNRFEPSHALALSLKPEQARQWYDLDSQSQWPIRYLKGETLTLDKEASSHLTGANGWILITVDGFSAGFGKRSSNMIKNHYPKGLRLMC